MFHVEHYYFAPSQRISKIDLKTSTIAGIAIITASEEDSGLIIIILSRNMFIVLLKRCFSER